MPGDHHVAIGIATGEHGHHVRHLATVGGHARSRGDAVSFQCDAQSSAVPLVGDALELGDQPAPRRADPAAFVLRIAQRVSGAALRQGAYVALQPLRAPRSGPQLGGAAGDRGGGEGGERERREAGVFHVRAPAAERGRAGGRNWHTPQDSPTPGTIPAGAPAGSRAFDTSLTRFLHIESTLRGRPGRWARSPAAAESRAEPTGKTSEKERRKAGPRATKGVARRLQYERMP